MLWRHESLCGCLSILWPNDFLGTENSKVWVGIVKEHYQTNLGCLEKTLEEEKWKNRVNL